MEPLDERYMTWLYELVGNVKLRSRNRTYWSLFRQLYSTEYVWFVPNDDNRVEDGRSLRYEFIDETDTDEDREWMGLGCSMLEMIVGLARRLSFEAEGEPRFWFWHLIENLDLADCSDAKYNEEKVHDALEAVIWRTYDRDGRGGLFPLKHASRNQTKVEVWAQLSAYILELD